MAIHTLEYRLEPVLEFVKGYLPAISRSENMVAIGLRMDGELIAGVLYEGMNANNVWMHIAVRPGSLWAKRGYLRVWYGYAFDICGVKRVSGMVAANNTPSVRLCKRLGYTQEAVLEGAAADGGDMLVFRMKRSECRYIQKEVGDADPL